MKASSNSRVFCLSALSAGYVISFVSCSLKVRYLRTKTIICLHHNTSRFRYHQSEPQEFDPLAQRTAIKVSFSQSDTVNPPGSTGSPRSKASGLSAAITLFSLQVSPTISSSPLSFSFSFFYVFLFNFVLAGLQLKGCSSTEEEPFLILGPIYCHFLSSIRTVINFSCAGLHRSSLQVMLSQKTFKMFHSTCVYIYIYN